MKRALSIVAAAACLLAPGPALAHTGAGGADGIVHGMMHPITGLDHVLAMVAVGVLAAFLGGRALWLIPTSFVAMAAVGGALGVGGAPVPYVEFGISASVVLLGLAIALQPKLPLGLAAGLVGLFGLYHGYAHGADAGGCVAVRLRGRFSRGHRRPACRRHWAWARNQSSGEPGGEPVRAGRRNGDRTGRHRASGARAIEPPRLQRS